MRRSIHSIWLHAQKLGVNNKTPHENIPWTEEETNIVKNYYSEFGWRKCKELLADRSPESIMMKAKTFGLTHLNKDKQKNWTTEEDNILREYYPTEGKYVSNRFPDRSQQECSARAYYLKLRKYKYTYELTYKDLDILRNYYLTEGNLCLRRIEYYNYALYTNNVYLVAKEAMKHMQFNNNLYIYCKEIDKSFTSIRDVTQYFKVTKIGRKVYHLSRQNIFACLVDDISNTEGFTFIYREYKENHDYEELW